MNENLSLSYYTTQAANRRHFQILFFAVSGFTWSFALAAFAVFKEDPIGGRGFASLSAGLVLVGGSFMAYRLLLRERSAFKAMADAWRDITGQGVAPAITAFRPGAMAIACGVQAIIGCGLVGFTLLP